MSNVSKETKTTSASFTMNMGHPEFKEGQFKDMAKAAISHLFTFCEDVGGGRFEGRFAFNSEMEKIGFKSNIAQFTLFLYEIGVVRRLRKNSGTQFRYSVINPTDFDKVVTDETIELSLAAMKECFDAQSELARLKKRLPTKVAANVSTPTPDHLEAMAEMVATVERLTSEVASRDKLISELQSQAVVTPEDTAAALIARFQKSKTAK